MNPMLVNDLLVQEVLGAPSAYEIIAEVYANLDKIENVSISLGNSAELLSGINLIRPVLPQLLAVADKLSPLMAIEAMLPGLTLISNNLPGLIAVSNNIPELMQVHANLATLLAIPEKVNKVVYSRDFKDSCVVATTEDIVLAGQQGIDGRQILDGNRVLVRAQTDPTQNGIYTCRSGPWERAEDSVQGMVSTNATTLIDDGNTFKGRLFRMTTLGAITVGTSLQEWELLIAGSNFENQNAGTGFSLLANRIGDVQKVKTIKPGNNIAFDITDDEITFRVVNIGGGGEINVLSSLGTGASLVGAKTGSSLGVKSLKPGTNVTIDSSSTELVINATATGEVNTLTSQGSGTSLVGNKTDAALGIKSLKAGSNVSITSNGDEVTISSTDTDTGEVNTLGSVGTGTSIVAAKSGTQLRVKSIKAGSNISIVEGTDDITINAAGGAAGESNTLTKDGTGFSLVGAKVGSALGVKSLKAGTNITITETATELTIIAAGGASGEVNTLASLGAGTSLVGAKTGVALGVKSLKAGSNVSITTNGDEVTINSTDTNTGEVNTLSNAGTGTSLVAAKTGSALGVRAIKAGTNVTVSLSGDDVVINAATGSGEANTTSNMGTGEGIAASKSGVNLPFKSLKAGSNISISSTLDEITIAANVPAPGETNTLSSLGTANSLVGAKTGSALGVKSLKAGTNITISGTADELTINAAASGEANTLSSLGTATTLVGAKTGTALGVKSVRAGTNVTISETATEITINAAAGGSGEVNTLSSQGSGNSLVGTKVGAALGVKSIVAGTNVTISSTADSLTINATGGGGGGEANTLSSLGAGNSLVGAKTGTALGVKSVVAGTNVTISTTADSITINASGGSGGGGGPVGRLDLIKTTTSGDYVLDATNVNKTILITPNGTGVVNLKLNSASYTVGDTFYVGRWKGSDSDVVELSAGTGGGSFVISGPPNPHNPSNVSNFRVLSRNSIMCITYIAANEFLVTGAVGYA